MSRPSRPGALMTHPVVLAALVLWAINDHLLKPFGGELVGKLSDIACLIVVPVMLPTLVELWRSRGGQAWTPASRWLVASALGAALVMVTINTLPPAAWLYEVGLGSLQWPFRAIGSLATGHGLPTWAPVSLTMDPSDAFTIPAAAIPILLDRRRCRPKTRIRKLAPALAR